MFILGLVHYTCLFRRAKPDSLCTVILMMSLSKLLFPHDMDLLRRTRHFSCRVFYLLDLFHCSFRLSFNSFYVLFLAKCNLDLKQALIGLRLSVMIKNML